MSIKHLNSIRLLWRMKKLREKNSYNSKKRKKNYARVFSLLCFRFPIPYVYTENVKSSHGPYLTLMLGSMSPKTYKTKNGERRGRAKAAEHTQILHRQKHLALYSNNVCAFMDACYNIVHGKRVLISHLTSFLVV